MPFEMLAPVVLVINGIVIAAIDENCTGTVIVTRKLMSMELLSIVLPRLEQYNESVKNGRRKSNN